MNQERILAPEGNKRRKTEFNNSYDVKSTKLGNNRPCLLNSKEVTELAASDMNQFLDEDDDDIDSEEKKQRR